MSAKVWTHFVNELKGGECPNIFLLYSYIHGLYIYIISVNTQHANEPSCKRLEIPKRGYPGAYEGIGKY